jgi:hypothetical protein
MLDLLLFGGHKMTKQIERIIDAITGEVTERELTQAEILAFAAINPFGQNTPSSPSVIAGE